MLGTVTTVIVDEIHALVRDKRGSHLALSLERLEQLAGRPIQRIGLSATQKPLEEVGRFLVGAGRECTLVDAGTFRELDLGIEVPPSPLTAVCSHEQWEEIYARIAELVREHRTTLVFVNTRKMAERIAGQLTRLLGEDAVTSHHGSLSRARRLDAEERLKAGSAARAGGDGVARARHRHRRRGPGDPGGRHAVDRHVPPARRPRRARAEEGAQGTPVSADADELVEGAALLRCIRDEILDRTPIPPRPLDILAQQIVAACVSEDWDEGALLKMLRRAWPYRDLEAEELERVIALHAGGRRALLHRDGIHRRVMATRRARLTALLSGGAIPDTADYQVRLEPEGTVVGTVNEDWAIESNGGDIFQLGNTSWRILRVEPGVVRVADAKGQPPTLPFWLGEAPGRTRELAAAIGRLRDDCVEDSDVPRASGVRRRPARGGRAADRGIHRVRIEEPGARSHAAARDPRAVLRRERRHAARGARAVRRADQPRVGPGAAQAVLRGLRLRAAGGGQRGGDRPLARAAAQLRPGGRLRLPAARDRARGPRPGAPGRADVRDAVALERAALAAAGAVARGGKRVPAESPAHARRRSAGRRRSRRSSRARRRCRAARSRFRWTIRSCARRSRTA